MQTAASAGESLAAGVIFTFPALIIMSEDDDDSDLEGWGHFRYVETVVIAIAGGACVMCYSLIHSFTHSLVTFTQIYSYIHSLLWQVSWASCSLSLFAALSSWILNLHWHSLKVWHAQMFSSKSVRGDISYRRVRVLCISFACMATQGRGRNG